VHDAHVRSTYTLLAPTSSATAYEARSVAVPFGNCTEPALDDPGASFELLQTRILTQP